MKSRERERRQRCSAKPEGGKVTHWVMSWVRDCPAQASGSSECQLFRRRGRDGHQSTVITELDILNNRNNG